MLLSIVGEFSILLCVIGTCGASNIAQCLQSLVVLGITTRIVGRWVGWASRWTHIGRFQSKGKDRGNRNGRSSPRCSRNVVREDDGEGQYLRHGEIIRRHSLEKIFRGKGPFTSNCGGIGILAETLRPIHALLLQFPDSTKSWIVEAVQT